MEKRIKTLYLITIAAILAFLAMQVYWLYGRYVFSLDEYGRNLSSRIMESVDLYNGFRDSGKNILDSSDSAGQKMMFPIISLSISRGDTIRTARRVSIYTYSYHRVLGVDTTVPLTKEMRAKALDHVYANNNYNTSMAYDSVHYDASKAKDENETWTAAHNVVIAKDRPFTKEGIDSVLRKNGIKADIIVSKVDSMVWNKSVRNLGSLWRPELYVMVPFSQLEGRIVEITCRINPYDVVPMMWPTLVVVLLITVLLIICLILQFSTILKLSRLDRMRNSFITTMIHELKRPISTLKMCVSGIENNRMMEDPETKRELMRETRNSLDNLSAYFSKLRDITFNDVEQIPLNIRSVNLRGLFSEVTSAMVVPADKEVDIVNDIDSALEVSADQTHLVNIVGNLIENAVKYSGRYVEIKAESSEINGIVHLRISDTGNGISSGDLRHIFKRFYRGRAAGGDQPGMGLGLAYVKLLVEAHGGDITVDSKEGEGTCFTIKLPQ
ncbi:MAG: HAMP domain-containing histidine kinase [Muribaculaceae bacterium]|nr:HAMP domain-containing histidine kinase [Muribaculaceae bacterium]